MNPERSDLPRRDLLKAAAVSAAAGVAGVPGCASNPTASDSSTGNLRRPDLIRRENLKQGALDWQLTRVRVTPGQGGKSGYRSPWIEGYCSHQSIAAGQKLSIFVSTNPPSQFTLEIFRMGYYGGRGARHMTTLGPFSGAVQPDPPVGPMRLRDCRWEPSCELTIPADWVSGVYLGRLKRIPKSDAEAPWQSYVIFIVRDDRPADVLFQCSDNTWQAYNRWPDNYSLYTDPRAAHAPDVAVSFNRPYGKYVQIVDAPQTVGSGEFLLWEYPLCFWLEQQGYDVTYCSNSELLSPERALLCKSMLSVGHDEYWDQRQYRSVQTAIERGVNMLWLSANSVYMVSPFTPDTTGRPNRILTRKTSYGELSESERSTYAKVLGPFTEPAGPDERHIIGARSCVPFNGGGSWTCTRPDHWIFAGTGMKKGESIPGLVGWEYHGEPADKPGLEVVAEGPVLAGGSKLGRYAATIFPGPRGNFVFNAATIWWSQALAKPPGHMLPWSHWTRPHGPDDRIQRITANLLKRATA